MLEWVGRRRDRMSRTRTEAQAGCSVPSCWASCPWCPASMRRSSHLRIGYATAISTCPVREYSFHSTASSTNGSVRRCHCSSRRPKEAAFKALEIDDTLAEGHTALAAVRRDFDWDWVEAEKDFNRGFELNPR